MKYSIREIINFILSISAILLSLLSFFGIMQIAEIESKIPSIILALLGILIINSTLERKKDLKELDRKIDRIISLTSGNNLEKMEHITNDIPETLSTIFIDYINDFKRFIRYAITNETIEFSDLQRFKSAYIKTLEFKAKKRNTFLATSLPYKRYFWVNNEDITPMIQAMSDFVNSNKGKFERIFFVEHDDLNNEEVIEVLDKQLELGITVYTIRRDRVPSHLQKFFVVDDQEELAWQVHIDPQQRINSSVFTTSSAEIDKFKSIYSDLRKLDDIKPYL